MTRDGIEVDHNSVREAVNTRQDERRFGFSSCCREGQVPLLFLINIRIENRTFEKSDFQMCFSLKRLFKYDENVSIYV